jgi:hypothetical protein
VPAILAVGEIPLIRAEIHSHVIVFRFRRFAMFDSIAMMHWHHGWHHGWWDHWHHWHHDGWW